MAKDLLIMYFGDVDILGFVGTADDSSSNSVKMFTYFEHQKFNDRNVRTIQRTDEAGNIRCHLGYITFIEIDIRDQSATLPFGDTIRLNLILCKNSTTQRIGLASLDVINFYAEASSKLRRYSVLFHEASRKSAVSDVYVACQRRWIPGPGNFIDQSILRNLEYEGAWRMTNHLGPLLVQSNNSKITITSAYVDAQSSYVLLGLLEMFAQLESTLSVISSEVNDGAIASKKLLYHTVDAELPTIHSSDNNIGHRKNITFLKKAEMYQQEIDNGNLDTTTRQTNRSPKLLGRFMSSDNETAFIGRPGDMRALKDWEDEIVFTEEKFVDMSLSKNVKRLLGMTGDAPTDNFELLLLTRKLLELSMAAILQDLNMIVKYCDTRGLDYRLLFFDDLNKTDNRRFLEAQLRSLSDLWRQCMLSLQTFSIRE